MSNKLGLARIFEILEALRLGVKGFADRESALEVEYGKHSGFTKSRAFKDTEQQKLELKRALREEEASRSSAQKHAGKRYESRAARIENAFKASRNRALRDVSKQEGAKVFDAQWELIQTRKNLANDLKQTHQRYEDYFADLSGLRRRAAMLYKGAGSSLRGYRSFMQRFTAAREGERPDLDLKRDEFELVSELGSSLETAAGELKSFRKRPLPLLFRVLPVSLLGVLFVMLGVGGFFLLKHFGWAPPSIAAVAGGAGLLGVLILYFLGKGGSGPAARSLIDRSEGIRRLAEICQKRGEENYEKTVARIENDQKKTVADFDQHRQKPIENVEELKESLIQQLEQQQTRAASRNDRQHEETMARIESDFEEKIARLKSEAEEEMETLSESLESDQERLSSGYQKNWDSLVQEWEETIEPLYDSLDAIRQEADRLFPDWTGKNWEKWSAPTDFCLSAQFGRLEVDIEAMPEVVLPESERLALPGPASFSLPASLTFPWEGSAMFETGKTGMGRDEIIGALNSLVLRLLSVCPPGKLAFTIIDPVGLGEGFSGVMHLADHDEALINGKIWTQADQIERQLADLNEHIEKVIQMYLRNDFETITEYNREAESIAEKFHFVVVADFPAGFTEVAVERLLSIANSGARCGVYSFIHWDKRHEAPQEFTPQDLARNAVRVGRRSDSFFLRNYSAEGVRLELAEPPETVLANELIHRFGESSRDANRVEVPFADVTPDEAEFWSGDTTKELVVPIGRTGATKLQYLSIGKGTRQHALIAGKTGSGKSTLFHVMITNLAAWCNPEQVEFYLIDFKKGVEFKAYATGGLPHARVIAIESDREFGLSVIQRVDAELKRRGDLFRKLGVQDLAGFKKAGGDEPMPRTLLLIDEFQELFTEDDRISQDASVLLDRIVRQGRAFGIHVILGSQTLGGANTIPRTTLGQMVIRVALQCNEADAYLIMDDSNPAPRLLTRPGEGIYNDAAGMIEGNSPFQVVWLSDEDKDAWLAKIRQAANEASFEFRRPIVFEGNAPADIHENVPLRKLLTAESVGDAPASARFWLGAPNSIKGPTEAGFLRQSGNNLMIVGQRDEAALAIQSLALIALSAQFPRNGVRFAILDSNAPGTPGREYIERVVSIIPHDLTFGKAGDVESIMSSLDAEIDARLADDTKAIEGPPVFLFVNGLQRFKKLRQEEDFSFSMDEEGGANPGDQFDRLITEGPGVGVFLVASCDTYNNLSRTLSRKAISEIEMRVLFQMSANDSSNLIDTPKAGNLGLHRALFYNEQEGHLETFRPYALPESDWIEEAEKDLARLLG